MHSKTRVRRRRMCGTGHALQDPMNDRMASTAMACILHDPGLVHGTPGALERHDSTAFEPVERTTIGLHGQVYTFRAAGSGPLLVLLHGITGSSKTWEHLIPRLSQHYRVVAPDLIGHGESAKPPGDYSLGAYANLVRDLLEALGEQRGTIVGHSLGGGVAMQFAYQYPERCERLVLVSSGGLGREVHPILRAAALPGAEL